MKHHSFAKVLILTAVLGPALLCQIGCPAKSSPSSPSNNNGGNNPTNTPTVTQTPTATLNPLAGCVSFGSPATPGTSTFASVSGTVYASPLTVTDAYGDELYNPNAYLGHCTGDGARMAVFDSTGAGSGPGTLLGESGFFVTTGGPGLLNTQATFNPTYLPPGSYWFAVQSNNAAVSMTDTAGGTGMTWSDSAAYGSTLINNPSATLNSNKYAVNFQSCASTFFGNATTAGGANDVEATSSTGATFNFDLTSYSLPQTSIVHAIGFYLVSGFTGTSGGQLQMGIYSDNGGVPGTLQQVTYYTQIYTGTLPITNKMFLLPLIQDTPLPAGNYWLAIAYNSYPGGNSWTLLTQTGGNSASGQYNNGGGLNMPTTPTGLTPISNRSWVGVAAYNP
jgi:hypothetical protein